jgi:NitT/TauT family transport system substrate-binding protein
MNVLESGFNRRDMLRLGLRTSALPLFGTMLAGCWDESGKNVARTPMVVTAGANFFYGNQMVAIKKGFTAENGIDAELKLFDVGFLGTQAVVANQATTAGTVEFPLISLVAKGADLIVPAITEQDLGFGAIVNSSIREPGDFAGKKIGIIVGSSGDYAFAKYMEKYSVNPSSVKFVNLQVSDFISTLARGDTDGFIWQEPTLSLALSQLGDKVHLMEPRISTAYTQRVYLEVARSWAEKNRAALVGYLKALIQAEKFIESNPDEAASMMGSYIHLDGSKVRKQIETTKTRFPVQFDGDDLKAMQDVAVWMKEKGKIDTVPDIKKIVDTSYLKAADPSARVV